jgi:Spy/CpxP family protein refolding chaperone
MLRIMMIAAIAVFMLTISTFAQPRLSPQERVKALTERLSLTKDQAAQIEKILIQSQDQMKKMNSDGKTDRSEFRKKMDETQAQIEKLLDDKQKAEFKKMQDERRKSMQNRKPGDKTDNKTDTKPDNQKKD